MSSSCACVIPFALKGCACSYAVIRASRRAWPERSFLRCHPERSRRICGCSCLYAVILSEAEEPGLSAAEGTCILLVAHRKQPLPRAFARARTNRSIHRSPISKNKCHPERSIRIRCAARNINPAASGRAWPERSRRHLRMHFGSFAANFRDRTLAVFRYQSFANSLSLTASSLTASSLPASSLPASSLPASSLPASPLLVNRAPEHIIPAI